MSRSPKDPNAIAAKWQRGVSGSTQAVKDGVMAVTQSPMEAAAKQQDAYVQGVQNAAQNGKWARGLRRVSTQDWQASMINKGLQRIASGATAAMPKVVAFQTQLAPHLAALQSKLSSMPRGSLEQNKQRMLATVDHMATFKRS